MAAKLVVALAMAEMQKTNADLEDTTTTKQDGIKFFFMILKEM